jgi:hypothetical protein
MNKDVYYNKVFYKKHGWASCYECDITFEELEKLFIHQNIHLKEEMDRVRLKKN